MLFNAAGAAARARLVVVVVAVEGRSEPCGTGACEGGFERPRESVRLWFLEDVMRCGAVVASSVHAMQ